MAVGFEGDYLVSPEMRTLAAGEASRVPPPLELVRRASERTRVVAAEELLSALADEAEGGGGSR